jgi:hypothetical protein
MKTALYGRSLFGASAVLLGVVILTWHDSDTYQHLRKISSLPFGTIIMGFLAIAQIAGGLGMLVPRTVRLASIVLGIVYAIFSLACIPGMIAAPTAYVQYGSFFEEFCLVCGAIAAYAASEPNAARAAALGRVARIGLGLCATSFAVAQKVYLHFTATLVPTWIPPNQLFWAILTTIAFAFAAVAILINFQARLAMRLMALMVALFGVLVWIPILIAHPEAHVNWAEFALTFLIAGAAAMVADLSWSVRDQSRGSQSTR